MQSHNLFMYDKKKKLFTFLFPSKEEIKMFAISLKVYENIFWMKFLYDFFYIIHFLY